MLCLQQLQVSLVSLVVLAICLGLSFHGDTHTLTSMQEVRDPLANTMAGLTLHHFTLVVWKPQIKATRVKVKRLAKGKTVQWPNVKKKITSDIDMERKHTQSNPCEGQAIGQRQDCAKANHENHLSFRQEQTTHKHSIHMKESRRVSLGMTVEYIERKFKTKA